MLTRTALTLTEKDRNPMRHRRRAATGYAVGRPTSKIAVRNGRKLRSRRCAAGGGRISGNRRTLPCNTRDRCLEPSLGHVKTECMTDRRTRTSPADSIVTKADTPSTGNCEHMTATTTRRFVLDSWRAGRNPIHHQHRSPTLRPARKPWCSAPIRRGSFAMLHERVFSVVRTAC